VVRSQSDMRKWKIFDNDFTFHRANNACTVCCDFDSLASMLQSHLDTDRIQSTTAFSIRSTWRVRSVDTNYSPEAQALVARRGSSSLQSNDTRTMQAKPECQHRWSKSSPESIDHIISVKIAIELLFSRSLEVSRYSIIVSQ
jgi:hypothetical protein